MNKYLKYGWVAVLLVIPVFLNFSKTERDVFTTVSSSSLNGVKSEMKQDPELLKTMDNNGFTLYDYAVLNDDPKVQKWLLSQKVGSGVSKEMIERIRLWFLLLGIPVNSTNFNLKGTYDKGLEEAILSYQTTRGLEKNPKITPDWYAHLEEEGIRLLQELLFEPNSENITGTWNSASSRALKAFQTESKLPVTGHLSIADIVAIKRAFAGNIAEGDALKKAQVDDTASVQLVEYRDDVKASSKNAPDVKVVLPKPEVAIEAPIEEKEIVETVVEKAAKSEPTIEEPLTAGFLIDSHAKEGKLLNLQVWLTLAGFPAGTLDGQMGPSTRQAIKEYQTSIGQKPTGSLDAKWESPLEKNIWKKVQEKLKQLKLYDQDVDGIPGASTVNALKAYEESVNLPPKGQLLPETLSTLFNEGQMFNDGSMDDVPIEADNTEEDGIIEEEGDDEGTVDEAEPVVEEETATVVEETPVGVGLPGFNPKGTEESLKLQLMLAMLGLYKEEVNGEYNNALIEGIKAFQKEKKLGVDGKIGRNTSAALNAAVITRLQTYFIDKGLMTDAPTGTLGPKTRNIVKTLREQHKLPVNKEPQELDIGILLIVLGDLNNANYVKTYVKVLKEQEALIEQTKKVQEYLIALGHFNGKVDGLQGKATNTAIEKFKKEQKLPVNDKLTPELMKALEKETLKTIQSQLVKLGYKLKPDGMMGPATKKTIETFQKRYSYKVTGEGSLETLNQVNTRVAANNRRAPPAAAPAQKAAPDTAVVRGVMPKMGAKGAQTERILTAPPQAIVGRMTMIYNSKGALSGCKVNNISISAAMCGGARNNQQCRIVYRKGRVLSVSCRG
ncbi:peptidoglycan-binding protein [Wohlfahrtiimonas chitiniclastica]|uniref:peptidoglycan-binding domain-containing protein n=1 Tax=Wohlfahrtiimonas chitiniclastica TaxID=400946 RepID=UPI001BCCFFFB|nr:peptidoglycan-binding protein [Wohlfahrtiimonas chitiniclastica]MBS7833366.1 peptidoglycan-binding protein [Wohlfahrtiimonas chitiniclastica]